MQAELLLRLGRPYKAVLAVVHLLLARGCGAPSCAAAPARNGGSALLQLHAGHSAQKIRAQSDSLFILVTTGIPVIDTAVKMQASMVRRLRPQDRFAHICEAGCAAASNGSLHNIIEMNESAFPGGPCVSPGWRIDNFSLDNLTLGNFVPENCSGYLAAQMKFVYGLVHMVREMKKEGAEMPGWWLVKDDDTYAHVPNLMKTVERYSPKELVSFAEVSCPGICGGAGWLLSNALAERLVLDHGERWMEFIDFKLRHTSMYSVSVFYDVHIPRVISWVPGAQLLWHLGMQNQSPFDNQCNSTTYQGYYWDWYAFDVVDAHGESPYFHGPDWKLVVRPLPEWPTTDGICYSSKACACSYSPLPSTWHLEVARQRGLFEEAIALLDLDSPMHELPVVHRSGVRSRHRSRQRSAAGRPHERWTLSVLGVLLALAFDLSMGGCRR